MEEWEAELRERKKALGDIVVDMIVNNERRRRQKEKDAEQLKINATIRLTKSEDVGIVPMTSAATSIPSVPPAYYKYAVALTAAIEYLSTNNYATAKVPVREFSVTPQHLRNSLRTVRNFMMSTPPSGYPIENLTFMDVPDGVIVRDKRKSEPFKITVPVSKPSGAATMLPYPIVTTPEMISALGVVLRAVDQSGAFIEWPDFVLTILEPENIQSYNDLMRHAFPSHWIVGPPVSMDVLIKRKLS